ncbi:hypothetical protein EPO33_01875 [Patescibacteria group bacterium]|nr:MAG: hypothetical protein EPO33_01875 [Patescibacteria group bacterium]
MDYAIIGVLAYFGPLVLIVYLAVGGAIGSWFWEEFAPEQIGWECEGSTRVVAVGVVALLWPAVLVCLPLIVVLRLSFSWVSRALSADRP